MKKLRTAIERCFGIPWDLLGLRGNIQRIDTGNPEALFYGSPDATARPYLTQSDMHDFISATPPTGFCQVGFWGHGVNSHAVYISRVTRDSKVYFRLPYGGIYGDERLEARQVRDFLLAFLEFETAVLHSGFELLAIESMGVGRYRVTLGGWPIVTHDDSMLTSHAFDRLFGMVPSAQPGDCP